MINRVENSPVFGSTIIRNNVFKKGLSFNEKFGTNIDKKSFRQAISFLENDGADSVYSIEESTKSYPTTDYVLLKDGNVVKVVGSFFNPEYNIIATIVRYAKDLGANL